MLRNMHDLLGYAIRASDGPIGHVKDFYFDDEAWVVRYLVVDTGTWLSSRKVLISPFSIGRPDRADKTLPASITQEQVKNSPDIDTDKPVSRQYEMSYLGYYGYPYYWGGVGLWGIGSYPGMMLMGAGSREAARHEDDDSHLRSCEAVIKYHVDASDGGVGHVVGMLLDEESWAIRYLIVNTSNWWLGHEVLIAPQWITDISWPARKVSVNLTRQAVKEAPPYDPALTLDRNKEIGLHKHYQRDGYWANEVRLENPQFHNVAAKESRPGL